MSRSSRRTSLPGLRRLPAVLALATIGLGLQALPAVAASAVPGCDAYWTGDADST